MSEQTTTVSKKRRLWRNAITTVIALALGVLITVLAVNGTLTKWFGHQHQNRAATGQLWTCGMHPQVIQNHPGICPICHMDLTPLKATAATTQPAGMPSPAVTIDPSVVQNMGIRSAKVTRGPLQMSVRAVGLLKEAEPNLHDINLRVSGWVEKLHANTVGMHITKGEPLFELYSPQLQTAVQELIAARRAAASTPGGDELSSKSANALHESAVRKLELLGLSKEQIAKYAEANSAPRTVTFTSPVTGHVTEKMVVEGAAVKEGERALRIVDHSTLWLDAQIYESQLAFIKQGQKVTATVAAVPGKNFDGDVMFVHPHVDPQTRTVMVRAVVPNQSLVLKPGMYATVFIAAVLSDDAVLVPREAIIDTGTRQIVFLVRSAGHFEPRTVKMGAQGQDDMVQVLDGLAPGETVVTSGQFLIDAESRVKEAIQKHLMADATPAGPATAPSTQPTQVADKRGLSELDSLAKAYLQIADFFGKPQQSDQPADMKALIAATKAAATKIAPEKKPLADTVMKSAMELNGKPIAEQRKLFKPLSEAVIALFEQLPPSQAVAQKLLVMHCPMADANRGANWLQISEPLANPYFPTRMKRCGEVKTAIELRKQE